MNSRAPALWSLRSLAGFSLVRGVVLELAVDPKHKGLHHINVVAVRDRTVIRR